MSQKVALITGSATGIGRAAALRFARAGFAVAVNYSRSEADANETFEGVKKLGVPAILCKANVGDDAAVKQMFGRVRKELGGLDVLVNNAGMTHFIDHTNLDALTDAVWQEIFQTNLLGTFYCCRAALPLLQERNGSIVNVTSVAGLSGQGSSIPYAASKAAANSLTRSLAAAFGPKVRVNAVAPGPVQTRWLTDHQERVRDFVKTVPMQRAALPDDIADAIYFLALGTTLATGQVLVIDGGRTM
jgi:3-oxoacyl-[acyl-carrier protein] reductase